MLAVHVKRVRAVLSKARWTRDLPLGSVLTDVVYAGVEAGAYSVASALGLDLTVGVVVLASSLVDGAAPKSSVRYVVCGLGLITTAGFLGNFSEWSVGCVHGPTASTAMSVASSSFPYSPARASHCSSWRS